MCIQCTAPVNACGVRFDTKRLNNNLDAFKPNVLTTRKKKMKYVEPFIGNNGTCLIKARRFREKIFLYGHNGKTVRY